MTVMIPMSQKRMMIIKNATAADTDDDVVDVDGAEKFGTLTSR